MRGAAAPSVDPEDENVFVVVRGDDDDPPPMLIDDRLARYLDGYDNLLTCGTNGVIPWDRAIFYAARMGMSQEMQDVFWEVMQRMMVFARDFEQSRPKHDPSVVGKFGKTIAW